MAPPSFPGAAGGPHQLLTRHSHHLAEAALGGGADAAPECEVSGADMSYPQLRIASIFVILAGSMLGAVLPIWLARSQRMHVPKLAFFVAKYFGSGVILATAWIHLLAPAADALGKPCLEPWLGDYDWAFAIGLMTVMAMFFIELMAARFDMFGIGGHHHSHDAGGGEEGGSARRWGANDDLLSAGGPRVASEAAAANATTTTAPILLKERSEGSVSAGTSPERQAAASPAVVAPSAAGAAVVAGAGTAASGGGGAAAAAEGSSRHSNDVDKDSVAAVGVSGVDHVDASPGTNQLPGRQDDVSYPPGGEDHLLHRVEHAEGDNNAAFAAQMTAIFILEFGVVFHSIFVGLTLAVAEDFVVLFIVLVFHQTFEGLGLGSRLATAPWPPRKQWVPYLLGAVYGVSTPLAIAVGLGVRSGLQTGSARALIIEGVFDAVSAGILMYTGLVELLAHEFMFNPHMRNAKMRVQLFAYACVAAGAGIMALLGKWA